MSLFLEDLPIWDNTGIEPDNTKKTDGWEVGEKPPAEYFNWLFNRIYKCLDEIQSKIHLAASDTGTANAYAITLTGITDWSEVVGVPIIIYAANANTGASTLQINSLTTKSMVKQGNGALAKNDILANSIITAIYDGTNVHIAPVNPIFQSLFTTGDLPYCSADGVVSRLAIDADATKLLGISGGVPAWISGYGKTTTGSYNGNASSGTSDRTITIGFTPKLVVIYWNTSEPTYVASIGFGSSGYCGLSFPDGDLSGNNSSRPAMTTNGFIIAGGNSEGQLNKTGVAYNYVAFG
jgi:hypothetical protein